jgi:hypothetical protein
MTCQLMSIRIQSAFAALAPSRYRARSVELRPAMPPPAARPNRPPDGELVSAEVVVALWAEVAVPVPAVFVAETVARSVDPTSPLATTYELAVAPEIDAQFAPAESQRFHWYA